jgi:hypothetical protein
MAAWRTSALALIFVIGCGPEVTIGLGEGSLVDASELEHAIFASAVLPFDFNGDGFPEMSLSALSIVASDHPGLCEELAASPDLLSIPELLSAAVTVYRIDPGPSRGFEEGVIEGEGIGSELYANMSLYSATQGQVQVRAYGDGTASLQLTRLGNRLSGEVSDSLRYDSSDAAVLDTDIDGDGDLDGQRIEAIGITGSFHGLKRCEALEGMLF